MAQFDREDTLAKVKAVVSQKLSVEIDSIKSTATLQDLGADSIDMVEIILKLEDQFGIEIDDEKAESLTDVSGVVDYVHSLRKK